MITDLRFYTGTRDTWDAMYEDCRQARASIRFDQYILKNDAAGRRFLELFHEKALEGVQIALHLDGVGSRSIRRAALVKKIRRAGGEVHFYNPLGWRNIFFPSSWLPRNHCKTMLIDGKIAYTGGVCIAQYMQDWQDMQARITGRLAEKMARDVGHESGVTGDHLYRYMVNTSGTHLIYDELLEEISRARRTIYLATAYFFPPRRLRQALADAVRRGVQVTLMLPEKTDVPLATYFASSYFPEVAAKGIRILIYANSVLHAKVVAIDDDWATIGSTNLDYLSLFRNKEGNLMIRDPNAVARIKEVFERGIPQCQPADPRPKLLQKLLFPLIRRLRRLF